MAHSVFQNFGALWHLLCSLSVSSSSPSVEDKAKISVPADRGRKLWLGLELALELGPQTPRCARRTEGRGRGGHRALTSESQAGDRVAAPVLLHTGQVAGPHQQAAQHGSGVLGAQRRDGSESRNASKSTEPRHPPSSAIAAPEKSCSLRGEVPTPGRGFRQDTGR